MNPNFYISAKIWWSITWRAFYLTLLAIFCMVGIYVFLGMLINNIDLTITKVGWGLLIFLTISLFILLSIYIYQRVFNRLIHLLYREGKVHLMINDEEVDTYGFMDALCLLWSMTWREIVLSLGLFFVATILEVLGIFSFSLMNATETSFEPILIFGQIIFAIFAYILIPIWALQWTLRDKRDGRWLKFAPDNKFFVGNPEMNVK